MVLDSPLPQALFGERSAGVEVVAQKQFPRIFVSFAIISRYGEEIRRIRDDCRVLIEVTEVLAILKVQKHTT